MRTITKKQNRLVWLLAFLASALVVSMLVNSVQPIVYQQNSAEDRIQRSLNGVRKWSTEKTFFLTQTNGSSTPFEVAKFECCGTGGAVTRDGRLVMGYLNTVEGSQIGTTSKVQIPEIDTSILIHELLHLVTTQPAVLARCPALGESRLQEELAYNIEGLYTQIKSLDEDGFIKLIK